MVIMKQHSVLKMEQMLKLVIIITYKKNKPPLLTEYNHIIKEPAKLGVIESVLDYKFNKTR